MGLCAMTVLFTACSKDDNKGGGDGNGNPPAYANAAGSSAAIGVKEPNGFNHYVKSVITPGKDSSRYTYDSLNRIVKWEDRWVSNGILGGQNIYATYAEGKLVKRERQSLNSNTKTLHEQFQYNGAGLVMKIAKYSQDGRLYGIDSISYNAQGLPIANDYYAFDDVKASFYLSSRNVITYDNNGNITKLENFHANYETKKLESDGWYILEFDGKPNALLPTVLHQEDFYLESVAKSNMTKATEYDADGKVTGVYTFEYTYNDKGFPTTVKQSANGQSTTMKIDYNIK
ncbi:hypothetical protein LX64_03799 [Chitinophaga skermanii]|uniref:Uncharacterized protein n=2 Tax=Chitinophaga skermanii TaxID=331697 RepID=A0A327QE79_9BACT|nr:hypothetical protein LX64_03799 [Chitinophaga skermanii]